MGVGWVPCHNPVTPVWGTHCNLWKVQSTHETITQVFGLVTVCSGQKLDHNLVFYLLGSHWLLLFFMYNIIPNLYQMKIITHLLMQTWFPARSFAITKCLPPDQRCSINKARYIAIKPMKIHLAM